MNDLASQLRDAVQAWLKRTGTPRAPLSSKGMVCS